MICLYSNWIRSDLEGLERFNAVGDVVERVKIHLEVLLQQGLVLIHGLAEGLHSFAPQTACQLHRILSACHLPLDLPSLQSVVHRTSIVSGNVCFDLRELGRKLAQKRLMFEQFDAKGVVGFDGLLRVVEIDADDAYHKGKGKTGSGFIARKDLVYGF